MIVSASKLRVRSEPMGQITNYLYRGEEVDVISSSGSWSRIQDQNSAEHPIRGWVASRYLENDPYEQEEGRIIKRIVIHCSATKPHQNFTAKDILGWHTNPIHKGGNGWSRAGYHWVITREPCKIEPLVFLNDNEVLSKKEIANGAYGSNRDSIHVCYVGGVDNRKRPAANITKAQIKEMVTLLQMLVRNRPKLEEIVGHNDLNPMKACPSFDVAKFLRKHFPAKFAKKYSKKK